MIPSTSGGSNTITSQWYRDLQDVYSESVVVWNPNTHVLHWAGGLQAKQRVLYECVVVWLNNMWLRRGRTPIDMARHSLARPGTIVVNASFAPLSARFAG